MQTDEIRQLKAGDLCPYCSKQTVKKHCSSHTCHLLRCLMCHLNFDPASGRVAKDK